MSEDQTTQSKYQRKKREEDPSGIKDNEVRIKGQTSGVRRYVLYAMKLLQGEAPEDLLTKDGQEADAQPQSAAGGKAEADEKAPGTQDEDADEKEAPKKFNTILLKATGRAINNAVTTAEIVKRRIPDLHQETTLETLEIKDEWEPLEEGLDVVTTTRRVASIVIKLTTDLAESGIDTNSPGYQAPLPLEAVQETPVPRRFVKEAPPKNSGRGGKQGGQAGAPAQGGGRRRRGGGQVQGQMQMQPGMYPTGFMQQPMPPQGVMGFRGRRGGFRGMRGMRGVPRGGMGMYRGQQGPSW